MLYRDYSRRRANGFQRGAADTKISEAIAWMRELNTLITRDAPGAICVAEESTVFPGVSAPVHSGGLGFHLQMEHGLDERHLVCQRGTGAPPLAS